MPTIKKYGAEWCGPCKKLDPILDEIVSSHDGVSLERFDIDEMSSTEAGVEELRNLGIQGIPVTYIFNDEGEQTHRIQGLVSRQEIVESLNV